MHAHLYIHTPFASETETVIFQKITTIAKKSNKTHINCSTRLWIFDTNCRVIGEFMNNSKICFDF